MGIQGLFSSRRVLFGLLLIVAPLSALAINGKIRVVQCAACYTTAEFTASAVSEAEQSLILGTKIVMSVANPRTAFVDVTGVIRNRCLPGEGCEAYLSNGAGTAINESGNPISSEAESNRLT